MMISYNSFLHVRYSRRCGRPLTREIETVEHCPGLQGFEPITLGTLPVRCPSNNGRGRGF